MGYSSSNVRKSHVILLQDFRDLQALKPEKDQLYSNLEAALPLFLNGAPPAVGSIMTGALEQADPTPELQMLLNSDIRLAVKNLYSDGRIESSSDCIHWNVLTTLRGNGYENEFFDVGSIETQERFYRFRSVTDL